MSDEILETNEDKVRAVFKARFSQNISLSKAFEKTNVASSTFYNVPEEVRLHIADEVRAEIVKNREEDESAQELARQQMLLDLRREFTDAAREALNELRNVMKNAQSDFVREKAAVDLLNFVERNFEGEARRGGDDDGQRQLPAPTVNVMMPIIAMPMPAQLQPVSQFTVVSAAGEERQIGEPVLEGEFTENK
ncbi:hypothetical protein TFLX_06603 [Thermoflexales bacterium]|nr:hypothetical protein TFLX_06603 [Thermoflexales bacterium]